MLIMQSKRSNYKKWHYLCIFIMMTKTIRKRRLAKQEYKQKKE